MGLACVSTALCAIAVVAGAEPFLSKQDIFAAGEGGYDLHRIPGMVATTQGTVLAYCEARMTSHTWPGADWAKMDVLMRRSTDGGRTWEPPRKIITAPPDIELNPVSIEKRLARPGDITQNNAVAIVDRDTGAVHFVYCIEYARCFHMRSDDEGVTFTEPFEITHVFETFRPDYAWRVIAVGPGHGIQLRNGRLLATAWLSTGEHGNGHDPSVVATIYSDDHGATWQAGAIAAADPGVHNPSEAVAIELADGRVMLNMRNQTRLEGRRNRLRAVCVSPDGVRDWGPVRFDEALVEPECMANLIRLSLAPEGGKNRILFSNPDNATSRERKNVTIKLSYDEGETWPVQKVLEPGRSGYSDLAVTADGTILCFYERGSFDKDHMTTAHLCVARFNLEWLTDGEDHLP